ncbi:MAG: hypothetical protein M5U19_16420 [Microthrixaceae bacterium]|nr:hypothetical protein [Microthrixaceae bacterium]
MPAAGRSARAIRRAHVVGHPHSAQPEDAQLDADNRHKLFEDPTLPDGDDIAHHQHRHPESLGAIKPGRAGIREAFQRAMLRRLTGTCQRCPDVPNSSAWSESLPRFMSSHFDVLLSVLPGFVSTIMWVSPT